MARKRTPSQINGYEPEDAAPVTPAADWRASFIKMLPSGRRARLRAVDISALLMAGDIPDLLTPLVLAMLFEPDKVPKDELSQRFGFGREELPVINLVCRAAFVEPRIVDEPQAADEIAIEDVELLDRAAVYTMVTAGVEVLRRFRLQPPPTVAAISDRDQDGPAPERISGGDGNQVDAVGGAAI